MLHISKFFSTRQGFPAPAYRPYPVRKRLTTKSPDPYRRRYSTMKELRLGLQCVIGTKSEFLRVGIFFIWIWAFLGQTLANRVDKCWNWKALLVE